MEIIIVGKHKLMLQGTYLLILIVIQNMFSSRATAKLIPNVCDGQIQIIELLFVTEENKSGQMP